MRSQLLFQRQKIFGNLVVSLILKKHLHWSLNNFIVGVNGTRDIMIRDMIDPNNTFEGMWSVITTIAREIPRSIVKN